MDILMLLSYYKAINSISYLLKNDANALNFSYK